MEAPLPAADEEQEARMSRVLSKRVKSCTFAKCNRLLLHPEITRLLPLPPSAFTLPRMHFRHVHYQDTTNRKRTYLPLPLDLTLLTHSFYFVLRASQASSHVPLQEDLSPSLRLQDIIRVSLTSSSVLFRHGESLFASFVNHLLRIKQAHMTAYLSHTLSICKLARLEVREGGRFQRGKRLILPALHQLSLEEDDVLRVLEAVQRLELILASRLVGCAARRGLFHLCCIGRALGWPRHHGVRHGGRGVRRSSRGVIHRRQRGGLVHWQRDGRRHDG